MPTGIRDKVVILGMGCSKFGEHWDKNAEDLVLDAYEECLADAGIETSQIDAAWFATAIEEQHVGKSGIPLAVALRLPLIPVTRVENYCASGTEAFRGAVYAVAAGAADIALAVGVEKLKDTGYGGLPQQTRGVVNDMMIANASAPGAFAQLASAYRVKHGVSATDLKRAMAQVSVKSHANAVKNPRAHLRREIDIDTVIKAPIDCRAARSVRLLRRVRRSGMCHRHDARDRAWLRQAGNSRGQGAPAVRLEWGGGEP